MKTIRGLSKPFGAVVGLVLLAIAGNAKATLIGDEVTFAYLPRSAEGTTGIVGVDTFTAGAPFDSIFTADIGASSIRLGIELAPTGASVGFLDASFQVLFFASLDFLGDPPATFVDAALVDTNVANLTQDDLTFGDVLFEIFIGDTEWRNNSFVEIDLISEGTVVVDLPAPMSLALFAIGLGGLGAMMRRRAV